jgi:lipoate-protein ligase A
MDHIIRILPYNSAAGPHNMAADEVMLEAAVTGLASLRVYSWAVPTVSLGYFQRAHDRLGDPAMANLPFVRRATGGGAIIHDGDLTYALALPPTWAKSHSPSQWHCRIHNMLAQFLREHQLATELVGGCRTPQDASAYNCFAIPQPGDVTLAGRKIIGGAQRLRAGSLLQHGSIQLRNFPVLQEHLPRGIAAAFAWKHDYQEWSPEEWNRIEYLSVYKYGQDSWNLKR